MRDQLQQAQEERDCHLKTISNLKQVPCPPPPPPHRPGHIPGPSAESWGGEGRPRPPAMLSLPHRR